MANEPLGGPGESVRGAGYGPAAGGNTLVIHPGALGDVLLAVPALRALKASFPGDALALAAQPRIARALAALQVIDTSIALDALQLDALFVEALPDPSDIDPADDAPVTSRSPDSRLFQAARVACWFGAADPGFTRRLLAITPDAVIAPSTPPRGGLVWEHLLHTIARWVTGSPVVHPIPVPPALLGAGRQLLQDAGWDGRTRLLMVHPGAGSAAKRWPAAAFARVLSEVVARDALRPVVHEGPADAEAVAELLGLVGRPALRLCQPELDALAGALVHVSVYLGNDSGVSHLAAAMGAPAVLLFTPAMIDWRPWAPARIVMVDCAKVERADAQAVATAVRTALAPS